MVVMKNIISLNDAVDQILSGDPEALEHVLKLDPGLSERLIKKLEDIAKQIKIFNPDIIHVQINKTLDCKIIPKELPENMPNKHTYTKYYSESYVNDLMKAKNLE
jgi:hypothetical protein